MNFKLIARVNLIFVALILLPCFFPSHDPDVFRAPCENNKTSQLLIGITRWDAEYFRSIGKHGYVYENQLAFFPLFPLALNLSANILYFFLFGYINFSTCIIFVGLIVNLSFHVITTIILHKLTDLTFHDKKFTTRAVIFYVFSPAKIFFISLYSESLFCFFTFSGLYYLKNNKPFKATLLFSLSAATRSNGILNIGYILYYHLNKIYLIEKFHEIVGCILQILLEVCLIVLPFIAYLWYGYYLFCEKASLPSDCILEYGIMRNYNVRGMFKPDWCSSYIPNFYGHIQRYHWNVGFLRYYEVKQVPNFLLAFPVILLVMIFAATFFNGRRDLIFNLGLKGSDGNGPAGLIRSFYPFVVHGVFLCVFGLLFMHVQVTTRMVASSSPLLYWIGAWICKTYAINRNFNFDDVFIFFANTSVPYIEKATKLFFVGYSIIGCVAFSLYLPWT
ncbi:GPI mannosyltransferase 2-like [Artemia franciscana]|uniref:GPI mannosyltransferase 2 n=1 Tax=Artemia franciscana TaxID=6661 RepID=A0AA88L6K5_ARTSF|nr:hypothetical protein QYM36_006046 [Artemia franciscana]